MRSHELVERIDEGLRKEIQSLTERYNAVLEERRKGEAEVQQRKQALDQARTTLVDLDSQLTDFVFALAGIGGSPNN